VAAILAELAMDVEGIASALLHDTVEDVGVTKEEITERFGETVSGYVLEVTDDKSLPKEMRKALQIEHAPHLSHGAKQIKLADKISNITDVTDNPPDGWPHERKVKYVEWGEAVVAGLRGANAALEERFDQAVRTARQKFGM
jgi:guanosine-3',5'-bis(diphosphate) 3'-pyrophosphohydrolase